MAQPAEQRASSRLFRTWQMVGWLQEELGVPAELAEAVLSVWLEALRYAILARVEREEPFFELLRQGEATLSLSAGLAPEGWRDEHLWAQIAQQTGLAAPAARELLGAVSAKLREIAGEQAFEPVGQFWARGSGEQAGFTVRCRRDFLQPELNEPEGLVQGVADLEDEARPEEGTPPATVLAPGSPH